MDSLPSASFDAAFGRRAPHLTLRSETPADRTFLTTLFLRCSPLGNVLPAAMLAHQADIQQASHHAHYPDAMRRIIGGSQPIGRIVVDWSVTGLSHGVDIAVLPDHRTGGAGLHLLHAWLATADLYGNACSLTVATDNPAARLYRHLGFATVGAGDGPFVAMQRPARRFATAR